MPVVDELASAFRRRAAFALHGCDPALAPKIETESDASGNAEKGKGKDKPKAKGKGKPKPKKGKGGQTEDPLATQRSMDAAVLSTEAASIARQSVQSIDTPTIVLVGWPRTPQEAQAAMVPGAACGSAEPAMQVPSRGVSPAVASFLALPQGIGLPSSLFTGEARQA